MLDRSTATGAENPVILRKAMEHTMINKVGIFRNGPDLEAAVTELKALLQRSRHIKVGNNHKGTNPELVLAYRIPRMLKIALGIAMGALQRTESRGAHSREDYLERNDQEWLKRTLYSWPEADAEEPTIDYESLDVSKMELPPGSRGYGTDN
ncbi:fumarate reductase, partial [Achromatium sp. WMS3]